MKKEDRRIIALEHNTKMLNTYSVEIEESVRGSHLYTSPIQLFPKCTKKEYNEPTLISVVPMTSEDAVFEYSNENDTCVLNFCDNYRIGGGFLSGCLAQEEALCHSSFLYNVLRAFYAHYDNNYKNKIGGSLYYDWAIYSPDVIFERQPLCDIKKKVNVVSCPAPNISHEIPFGYLYAITRRINYLLDVMQARAQRTLILGAYGCGVFGNNPTVVANLFKSAIEERQPYFEKVIFAIPSGNNYDKFKEVFSSNKNIDQTK